MCMCMCVCEIVTEGKEDVMKGRGFLAFFDILSQDPHIIEMRERNVELKVSD